MQLNQAVSKRIIELLEEHGMTQYELFMKSGVPRSTIGNVVNCAYDSVKLRVIHEMCQGLGIGLEEFSAHHFLMKTIWNRSTFNGLR